MLSINVLAKLSGIFFIAVFSLSITTNTAPRRPFVVDSGQLPAAISEDNCTLKPSQMPDVYGFHLGMSLRRAIAAFPYSAQLSTLETKDKVELNFIDKSRNLEIRAWRVYRGGVVIEASGDYLRQRLKSKAQLALPNKIRLLFWSDRLKSIDLTDMKAARWYSIDMFISEVSETYGFSMNWWETSQVEAPPSLREGESHDFLTTSKEFNCHNLKVSAYCIGPPAPAGICSLTVRDTAPAGFPKSRN